MSPGRSESRELTEAVLRRCRELGFARVGVAPAAASARRAELLAWLADSRHGEMSYLERHLELRTDPRLLLPGARSVLVVADRYHLEEPEPRGDPARGRIARYARGRDYHRVIKKRLHRLCDEFRAVHPGDRFRSCVDSAPVLEREHAARAGLGAIGKHTLLIERGVGSYLLLGEVLTTLDLVASAPGEPDPCGTCTRCIDACPTAAITPWSVDARRCISYLTIEHRSVIDPALHADMGDWIFGCDVCQEVCPHNEPTRRTRTAAVPPDYAPVRTGFDLLDVLAWDEPARREAFTGSALKRARLDMMKRNALIAAGNAIAKTDIPGLRARIEAIARDEDEAAMVRDTARAVVARLKRRNVETSRSRNIEPDGE